MARKLQPATADDVKAVLDALTNLRSARDRLGKAGATSALEAVRSAIKSTEGALRHVQRRYRETLTGIAVCDCPLHRGIEPGAH